VINGSDWSQFIPDLFVGLLLLVITGVSTAFVAYIKSPRFRAWFRKMLNRLSFRLKWLIRQWWLVVLIVLGAIITAIVGPIIVARIDVTPTPPTPLPLATSVPMQTLTPVVTAPSTQSSPTTSTTHSDKEEQNLKQFQTTSFFSGEILVTIGDIWTGPYKLNLTIGSPGYPNQSFGQVDVGFAIVYETRNKYEVRITGLDDDNFVYTVHVLVTKLNP
jgi:hypothetical protein